MGSANKRLSVTFDKIYREKTKELGIEYPMYFRYCGDALRSVLKNIENNDLAETENSGEFYECRNGKESKVLYTSNIIAFMGGRGIGKTTALTEFGRILAEYHCLPGWNKEINYQDGLAKNSRFYVLPLIDASVLSEKDDLIEVILASMYRIIDKKRKDCRQENSDQRFREIITQFDEVYKDYLNVGNLGHRNTLDDSVLVKLRNVSDSLKLKASIEKLTEGFLELLGEENQRHGGYCMNQCHNRSYMVVPVDDLDMNPRSGFEMLDQLYKYFSNRRVIILTAIRYEQMHLLSQKNFVDGLIPEHGSTHHNKYEREARKLANDYLLKALPLANRIYLPERNKFYLEAEVEQKDFGKFDVKGFLLKKIADKTGIYYDAKGLKKHFCLPDTVRELVSYVDFLDNLDSLDVIEQKENVKSERQMLLYDQNHERFNGDLEKRFAMEVLNDGQLELYQKIMERHIERRAGYMLCFTHNWIKNRQLSDSVDELDFCYTDLLKILYVIGRKDYDDKPLVHCILASFTSEMVREYYSYQHNKDANARERAARRMKNFLGTTFGSEWLETVMPSVIMSIGERVSALRACYIKKISVKEFAMTVDLPKRGEKDAEKWLTDILSDNLRYVECVSACLVNAKDETGRLVSPEWKFSIAERKETEEGAKAVLNIKCNTANAGFDMFGFLGREMKLGTDAPIYDEKLFDALKACAVDYCDKHEEVSAKESILSDFTKSAEEKSIWSDNQSKAAFPYYNFDIAYNVVKRVRKQMMADETTVQGEQICEYYRKVYGYMAKFLDEEDCYYNEKLFVNDNRRHLHLCDDFINSPFIKAFGTQHNNERLRKDGSLDLKTLNYFFFNIIKNFSLDLDEEDVTPD